MAIDELARRIKSAKPKESELSDMLFGVVTGSNPLQIKVDNRFTVGGEHLILSKMVKDMSINVSVSVMVDGKSGSGSGTAQVFRSLQIGDRVKLLRVSNGQRFYVLERS